MTGQAHPRTPMVRAAGGFRPAGLPERYVRVPHRLLAAYAYDPLAVGIYSLIARLYLVAQAPLPLSAADITRYDPSLSRGAILPALARLIRDGWLIVEEQPGHKTRYLPSWGRVDGTARPWRMRVAHLGRPRHITALALDLRLLDTYIGRLIPHAIRPALVERYVAQPLLGLRDVGAYALTQAVRPTPTAALARWGLARHGEAQPVPSDQTILALASQDALEDERAGQLTAKGLRRLGLSAHTPPTPTMAGGQPLVFVPRELIGELIGDRISMVIDSDKTIDEGFGAAECANTGDGRPAVDIPWESYGEHGIHRIPPHPPLDDSKGGGDSSSAGRICAAERAGESRVRQIVEEQAETQAPHAETEAARLLQTLNIRPRVVAELADLPAELVHAAINDGRARPHVRDLAGWVVAMVRDGRDHGWRIPPATSDDPLALRASFARLGVDALAVEDVGGAAGGEPLSDAEPSEHTPPAGDDEAAPPLDDLTAQIRQALWGRVGRAWRPVIAGLSARLEGDALLLSCARRADLPAVQTGLLPCMRAVLHDLGWTWMPRIVISATGKDERPCRGG